MTEKMREEFEAWAVEEGFNRERLGDGPYLTQITAAAWQAWQASRAEVVGEFPEKKVIDTARAITYQGRPCRHCGGRRRYRSNQSCVNYRRCAPTPQQRLNRRRAALRKKEFLR